MEDSRKHSSVLKQGTFLFGENNNLRKAEENAPSVMLLHGNHFTAEGLFCERFSHKVYGTVRLL